MKKSYIAYFLMLLNIPSYTSPTIKPKDKISPLLMEKNKLLGVKLSLQKVSQVPVSSHMTTPDLIKYLLTDPTDVLIKNYDTHLERTKKTARNENVSTYILNNKFIVDELTEKNPFSLFDACSCMPQNPVYTSFAKEVVDRAVVMYQQKDPLKPFIYGSFASGGLFPDLYILTNFVQELHNKKIENIHLQVNLFDTDLRDYIFEHSRGAGRTKIAPIHSHMLFFKPASKIEFSHAENATDLITYFLQWFTVNLNIKLDLYIYGTAQDYVYDHEKNRVPSHDILVAIDYYPEAEGDLAQLALRTIKLGGYLCSVNNKEPEEIIAHPGLLPASYKQIAEMAKKEADEKAELEKKAQALSASDAELKEEEEQETQDDFAYTAISKKTAEITAKTFTDLSKRARGDNRKIGIIFDSLLYPESKILTYQAKKMQDALKFNPLNYFKIEFTRTQKY